MTHDHSMPIEHRSGVGRLIPIMYDKSRAM